MTENIVDQIYWHVEHGESQRATALITTLQKEAWHRGMSEAADVVDDMWRNLDVPIERFQLVKCAMAIRETRDKQ